MSRRCLKHSAFAAAALAAVWLVPMHGAAQAPQGAVAAATNPAAMAPTPRTPDGHPDLSGVWGGGGFGGGNADAPAETKNYYAPLRARAVGPTQDTVTTEFAGLAANFERDSGIGQRNINPANRPQYKPEYWEKVQLLDLEGNSEDPNMSCMPEGVPRMGAPGKIIQTQTELIFLYPNRQTYRVVYIDGRSHPPKETWEGTWMGHSIGRWEGDTLVIDTVDFNDASWLGYTGYFHSMQMHVIERMTRKGNTIARSVVVEDPKVLMQPWVMTPNATMTLNPDPKAELSEPLPCSERDRPGQKGGIVTKERG